MTMPKAPVDKYHGPMFCQHDIGCAGKSLAMQPEPKSETMKEAANDHLRAGVLPPYRPHDFPPDGIDRGLVMVWRGA